MKLKVTEQGVTLPKELFDGIEEVEIRKEQQLILLVPTLHPDPVFALGQQPVVCGIPDAAEHHDDYLYSNQR